MTKFVLPPEWHPQDAILVTWPHEHSAWHYMLQDVEEVYLDLVTKLSHYQPVIIQTHDSINLERIVKQLDLQSADISHCYFVNSNSNDTWARDHGPITLISEDETLALNFSFNGWGNKFESQLDDQLNQILQSKNVIPAMKKIEWVLEGGSIECDGNGTLLTTTQCNLNQNRNGVVNVNDLNEQLTQWFGSDQILWLKSGELEGDDTDAHIDTLARFTPNNTIIFQGCQRQDDSHFESLQTMKQELENLKNTQGNPYKLVELPLPEPKYASDGHRLPATYANFLITNKLVLVPIYQDKSDQSALALIQEAFPDHFVQGIDALPLIEEHGSLHCITMQLPRGSINFEGISKEYLFPR